MASSNQPSTVFRVRAHNTAADSENKIHDDQVASSLGFRGGLVPGITVYGYMIPPVLEVFGVRWLESGGMNMRFFSPCYEGETVASSCDGSVVNAKHEDDSLYASPSVADFLNETVWVKLES